jgi:phosphoribosyl 1,2-cyclic phosphodiesterase
MELRFWGVRGSIPAPGHHTLQVGGNTTCASLHLDGYVIVFDAGTGIRQLGQYLEYEEQIRWKGSVLLTHYHWDHIQGLPFFVPAFREENRFNLYGEWKKGAPIQKILSEQMEPPYFPVSFDALDGLATFLGLEPGFDMEISPGVNICTIRLDHPNGAIGYRVDSAHEAVCFITDHEHPSESLNYSVVEFVKGASVLVHDAQYTPEEKKGPKAGWGHSSWEEAALTAREAHVKQLYLIHHDPDRSDEELRVIVHKAQKVFANTDIATESTVYDLEKKIASDVSF